MSRQMWTIGCVVTLFVGGICSPTLTFLSVHGGYGLSIYGNGESWIQDTPVQIELICPNGTAIWVKYPYSSIAQRPGTAGLGWTATATVSNPWIRESKLFINDTYDMSHNSQEIYIARTVSIQGPPQSKPSGFSTRFSLYSTTPSVILDRDWFMPGIWYHNSYDIVPVGAIAGDPNATAVLVREDRLPLPILMTRNRSSGTTVVLANVNPNGSTFPGEDFTNRVVDARMQFGSIGMINSGNVEIAYQFPGSEGDRTYVCCNSSWANRSHPLVPGVRHKYQLRLTISNSSTYDTALRVAWRSAFEEANPRPPPCNLSKIYTVSMELLQLYGRVYNGVPVIPFRANLPDGVVDDTSSQMGFVGKAIPAAALLLRDAIYRSNNTQASIAVSIIENWVSTSMDPSGVPKTWFDIVSYGNIKYRADSPYMGHVRIASEGVKGVLDAYRYLESSQQLFMNKSYSHWLSFAEQYGNFLISKQKPNGSIAGEWMRNGSVWANFSNAADQPISLLLDLFSATRNVKFRDAAVLAGRFSNSTMSPSLKYIGGAVDNDNVLDKEGGILATKAFLALYDVTNDTAWIVAAAKAATYSETFTYAWDIPIPNSTTFPSVYPACRTTFGASLIATGQSGADNFMAITVYDYFKLYKITGDKHYLSFARFLSCSTKQIIDWDGKLGYAYGGLMNEAVTFAPRRGHGISKWLPWLTVAVLDPMIRMKDEFGTYEIPDELA